MDKCSFAQGRVKVLGHVISSKGIETDKNKIRAIVEMRNPVNIKEVRSFLEMVIFYRRFIKKYSIKMELLI